MGFQKQKRKMSIGMAILGILESVGEVGIGSFFPEQYPVGRFWHRLGRESRRPTRATFSVMLSRLQNEGLIARSGTNRSARWNITAKGKQNLDLFRISENPPRPDGISRLVIFDIPEEEKGKREALRRELAAIDYHQLQKSVWMGDSPLPMDFLELLDTLNLKKHVHILSVSQEGALKGTDGK